MNQLLTITLYNAWGNRQECSLMGVLTRLMPAGHTPTALGLNPGINTFAYTTRGP